MSAKIVNPIGGRQQAPDTPAFMFDFGDINSVGQKSLTFTCLDFGGSRRLPPYQLADEDVRQPRGRSNNLNRVRKRFLMPHVNGFLYGGILAIPPL